MEYFSFLMSFIAWSVGPGFLTKGVMYVMKIKPTERASFNKIYIGVVMGYLLISLVYLERSLAYNNYDRIGVNLHATDLAKDLKANYRKLSLKYHPDKLIDKKDEAKYIAIRKAYEVLKDPVMREAYDKFGDAIHDCTRCKTSRDYIMYFSMSQLGFYLGTLIFLIILTSLGVLEYGKYWRFASLFLCAGIEYTMLFTSSNPLSFIYWRPQFQLISILHQLLVAYSISLSQVGPILYPEPVDHTAYFMNELQISSNAILNESDIFFETAMKPFSKSPILAGQLDFKMQRLAIESRFRNDPEYSEAYQKAAEKNKNN